MSVSHVMIYNGRRRNLANMRLIFKSVRLIFIKTCDFLNEPSYLASQIVAVDLGEDRKWEFW